MSNLCFPMNLLVRRLYANLSQGCLKVKVIPPYESLHRTPQCHYVYPYETCLHACLLYAELIRGYQKRMVPIEYTVKADTLKSLKGYFSREFS